MKFEEKIPKEVLHIASKLAAHGFQVFLVGGCVRDLLLGVEPKDWDIATDATPQYIQRIFPDSVYENQFGTVAVKTNHGIGQDCAQKSQPKPGPSRDLSRLNIVEITTFRIEGKYTDKRHPDEVRFAKTIEEDLSRRDFTVNAIALDLTKGKQLATSSDFELLVDGGFESILVDPFGGQKDLKDKVLRTVGEPDERFGEDALRLVRAIRIAAEFGFMIEQATGQAIRKNSRLLQMIAKERIRDEFIKIILLPEAKLGVEMLEEYGLLRFIVPELREGIGVTQNKHHIYTVWEHNLRALDYAARNNYSLEVRLASLLHDVGKPRSKRGEGKNATFYAHEIIGAKMTARILDRLRFPRQIIEKVARLVRYHLFYYNVGEVSEAGVRRFIARVGVEQIDDLIKIREADRVGSGVPKAKPYRLRHLLFMIEKVRHDPISPKMLKINGTELMELLGIGPGPRVGWILNALLELVIEDPQQNTIGYLRQKALELNQLPDAELQELAQKAKRKKQEFESGIEEEMKRKYYV